MTRHPVTGAAQQRGLLYRNHPGITGIQNLLRSGAPRVPIGELVENKRQQLREKTKRRSVRAFPVPASSSRRI